MFITTLILVIGIAAQTVLCHFFGGKNSGCTAIFKIVGNAKKKNAKSFRNVTRHIAHRTTKSNSLIQVGAR